MKIPAKTKLIRVLCGLTLSIVGISNGAIVKNPIIWADIPDISIVRAGDKYYMSHTTMHMTPGLPIMESSDMVHWKTISYCYSTISNNNQMNLSSGENAYGKGTWASSIRYKDGTFYVLTFSQTSGKSHLFTSKDPKGPWKETILPFWHDVSLVLDDDGRNYVVYGNGNISITELNAELTGVKSGGLNKVILQNASSIAGSGGLGAEGSQVYKRNGYYYIFNICWPNGSMRTQLCYRSKSISGPYEGKVVLKSNGVAQGSVIQLTDSSWIGYLFQDNGSVGRSPWIMPVKWENDWPVFNNGTAPGSFEMPTVASASGTGIVTSDDFSGTSLNLEWQINHNPDNNNWSLTQRPGYYRIRTGRIDKGFTDARNSLTQRSFGPKCSGRISLDVSGLKDGDCAGLGALQSKFGFIGVKKSGTTNAIVMQNGTTQVATAELTQTRVFLRIDMDFTNKTDKATFFYSLDSSSWKQLGNTLQMSYELTHFMGYRFALFNYATKNTGGVADFDWFQIGSTVSEVINLYPVTTISNPEVHVSKLFREINISQYTGSSMLNVKYQLNRPGQISFLLYDTRGTLVGRFTDGFRGNGNHSVDISVKRQSGGHYILLCRLDKTTVATNRVLLIK